MTSQSQAVRVARSAEAGEVIAFGIIVAMGLFLATTASQYTIFREGGIVGGGFLPLAIGIVLTLLGGAQLIGAVRRVRTLAADRQETERRAAERAAGESVRDVFGRTPRERMKQLGLVFAATVVALALATAIGLLVSLGLLSLFISAVVEKRSWWRSLIIAGASVGLVWAIFVPLLGIPLPGGFVLDALGW